MDSSEAGIEPLTGGPVTIIGGLPITTLDRKESAQGLVEIALRARGQGQRPFYSTSANGQVIALARHDPAFRALLLEADQIHPDGMPMVRLSSLVARVPLRERVATTDLIHDVARLAEQAGVSFYFLGGTAEVNAAAVERIRQAYPGLAFAGARSGYFAPDEEIAIVDEIARLRPDILWIGFGVPLEQRFVARHIDRLRGVGVIKTSGGLFDFLSGRNSRAPQWMQAAGLEWAYRTMLEPRRLLGRYLRTNLVALWQILRHSK
ncbi:MAG: WecB/TagA/CpsF family glycosyltransferase [Bosea sp. (in: a-proteobacteria)]|uniref:WecB/TagA/CpsF family glycosyltransferase n=1 Tax=Bosea sp. (in: a-proteobacteria) TaxID=1871050 RepID=UPI002733B538|nr:WecB/TagA/CpsF family glycosyltransferase [Bosea sp. (in: a-proteobacteria)]MDP3600567.1 WecB/TagA/CpsF family glycosyltransferase [Bosea sp. (in: a-proteobacteria)]